MIQGDMANFLPPAFLTGNFTTSQSVVFGLILIAFIALATVLDWKS